MQTAFDIILADLFMCGFWVVGELLIKMFDLELKDEIDGGKAYQKKLDAAERQQHIVLAEDRRKNVRHAPEWNEQIKGWKERQKLQKKVSNLHKWSRAYTFYFIFWCLFVAAQYMVCVTAPKVKSYSRQYGMPIYYWTLIKSMGSPTFSGPYDYVIWSVVFLEAILFFAAAAVVSWPKPPLIRGVKSNANVKFYEDSGIGTKDLLTVKPRDFFKKETGIVQLIEDEHGGLIQDTCLLVACHMSTLTPERTATFSATIRSALKVFPAHAIFVCDNGPWQNPVDRTDQVCKAISRQHDSELLNAKVAVVMESNNEDCVAKVKSLTKKSNVLKKNITKKWGTTQQAYYDTFKDEVVEKLLNELAMVENQMKNLDKQIKRLDRDLKKMTIQKEQAEAAVIEIELLLEEERAKSLPPSRESSRQSSRKSKSRASTRQSSRGGMGNLAMGVEEQEMKAREISKQAKMVLLLSGITERLRSIAPPMHRQDILTIADPVAELSQGVLQKIAFIKIQSEGKSEEDQEDILMDAMESIDESASKHMMKELERCLQSLATKVTLGVWIGKPHKTKIEKPKTMKASLRVSRSNVRATGSQKKSNTRKQRQQRQQRQPQHKPPNSKKHSNPASKSELATQKLYVTELEMELNAMSRQVRGHGKLEEMERSMKQSTKLKRMLISKQLHYLGSKLKAEQAKKEILEQTMAESNDEVPEKEMRAAKFANLNAYANLKKELKDLKKLAKQQKISEVKLLNAYEEIAKVSNKVMHQNVDVFSAKGLQESKTRRDLLRLDMLQMTSPGKLTLSPIKKQGAYMHGLVGAKKPRDQPRTHRDEFLTTYHNKKALGVRKEEDE